RLRAVGSGEGVKMEEVYVRSNRVMKNHHSTCVYRDGFLYGFDDTQLKCIDFRKGVEKAGWDSAGIDKGTLILADRHLIIQTERGDLALAEATPDEFQLIVKIPKVL